MPVRFTQGDFQRIFKHFNTTPIKKGSTLYSGIGNDGKYRTCKLDFHSSGETVAMGTAAKMAKDLFFGNVQALKEYMDDHL